MPSRAEPDEHAVIDEISRLVLTIAGHMQRRFAETVSQHGLSPAQARLLRRLEPGEAVPMRELARRLTCDPSNLTDPVDKLEARGALERRPHASDRRVKAIALTPDGVRMRDEFWNELLREALPGGDLPHARALELRDRLREALGADAPPPAI